MFECVKTVNRPLSEDKAVLYKPWCMTRQCVNSINFTETLKI